MPESILNIWLVRVGTRPVASIVNQTEEMNTFRARKRTKDLLERPVNGYTEWLYLYDILRNDRSNHKTLLPGKMRLRAMSCNYTFTKWW